MKFATLFVVVTGLTASCAALAKAQQWPSSNTEFITSSSPLPDGSTVSTTFYPKSGALPETKWSSAIDQTDSTSRGPSAWSVLQQDVLRTATGAATAGSSSPRYDVAQLPSPPAANAAPPVAVQMPTWGSPYFGPRPYVIPGQNNAGGAYLYPQTAAAKLPTGTVYPYPVASTQPTLINPPVFPPLAAPPTSPLGGTPMVAGNPSSIRFQNLPPGTYFGRGLIGQPRAYVDGQPIRNLLRYVVP